MAKVIGTPGLYVPAYRAELLRRLCAVELSADKREDGVVLPSENLHRRDTSNGDEGGQKRVLDKVLALFLTNEPNEQVLHLSNSYN